MVNSLVSTFAGTSLSETRIVNVASPARVGVPAISPVSVLMRSPVGSKPLEMA